MSSDDSTTDKVSPKTATAEKLLIGNIKVLKRMTRYKDPTLQPVRSTQVDMTRYEL